MVERILLLVKKIFSKKEIIFSFVASAVLTIYFNKTLLSVKNGG